MCIAETVANQAYKWIAVARNAGGRDVKEDPRRHVENGPPRSPGTRCNFSTAGRLKSNKTAKAATVKGKQSRFNAPDEIGSSQSAPR